MPPQFFVGCGETNDNGRAEICDTIYGFHIDMDGTIDSGSLPVGQKLLLKTVVSIDHLTGGSALFSYKLTGAVAQEYVKVLLDGVQVGLVIQHNSVHWEELNVKIPMGDHLLEIQLLSDF